MLEICLTQHTHALGPNGGFTMGHFRTKYEDDLSIWVQEGPD